MVVDRLPRLRKPVAALASFGRDVGVVAGTPARWRSSEPGAS
jgi:hypothetical protein